MSLVAVPFYQKRHRHFDQSYRSTQARHLLSEYAARKRSSTQASSQQSLVQASSSQRAASQTSSLSSGGTVCRLCAKRVSSEQEESEQENKSRYRSLLASYAETKRRRFLGELADLEEDVHLARTQARDTLDKFSIQQMVEDKLAWMKEQDTFVERVRRAPEILVRLRSHTVWERMAVKLCFTVQGFPTPVVQWYKDGSLICQAADPGKYRIESMYGVHTLEINRSVVSVSHSQLSQETTRDRQCERVRKTLDHARFGISRSLACVAGTLSPSASVCTPGGSPASGCPCPSPRPRGGWRWSSVVPLLLLRGPRLPSTGDAASPGPRQVPARFPPEPELETEPHLQASQHRHEGC